MTAPGIADPSPARLYFPVDNAAAESAAKPRRVLMVCRSFYPAQAVGVHRPGKFCKYLPQFGWTPRVLTREVEDFELIDEDLGRELLARTDVVRAPSLRMPRVLLRALGAAARGQAVSAPTGTGGSRPGTFAGNARWWEKLIPDRGTAWTLRAGRIGRRAAAGCECVYSTSPPESAHLLARRLARAARLPWIADFRDPWTPAYEQATLAGWRRWLNRRLERKIIRNAKYVVLTTRAVQDAYRRAYPDVTPDKFVVIENGFDPDDYVRDADGGAARDGVFRLTYIGTLYAGREPIALLEALRVLLDQGQIEEERFELHFVGPARAQDRADVERLGLTAVVRFAGAVPHQEALRRMCASTALLVIGSPKTDHLVVGAKVYEYMYARRPILAIVPPGPIAELVCDHNLGLVAPPHDAAAVAEAVAALYQRFARGEDLTLPAGSVARFERRTQARQLADLLDAAVAQRR